ncbi:carbon-nitrogen hydrolase family protein [Pokkaliibacter plantistimulans]|uniref:carbon-nitrogen hydrolase family protein n=1 Tax=Pokkaliibacter plantistimulans TaxID=1635171 RepID=UPI001401D7D8|nr:carbon-nitrogen hydrolase family protein [Pokkaliibacter plantistimulans]
MDNGTLIISLVQCSSVKGDIESNLNKHMECIKLSAEYGADIVIFPELSLTGYELDLASELAIDSESPIVADLSSAAVNNNVVIISGIPLASDAGKPCIGALVSFPSGKTDCYRKQYLHPGEDKFISAGSRNYSFELKRRRVFLGICADFAHSQHWLDANKEKSDIYLSSVLISKNGFAHDSEILRHKAIEHNLNILMANYIGETGGWLAHGNSRAWDADGNVCVSANESDPCLVLCTVTDGGMAGTVIHLVSNSG